MDKKKENAALKPETKKKGNDKTPSPRRETDAMLSDEALEQISGGSKSGSSKGGLVKKGM